MFYIALQFVVKNMIELNNASSIKVNLKSGPRVSIGSFIFIAFIYKKQKQFPLNNGYILFFFPVSFN